MSDGVGAEYGARQFGAARTDKAGKAENLSRLHIEIYPLQQRTQRRAAASLGSDVAYAEPDRPGGMASRGPAVEIRCRAPDHQLDDSRNTKAHAIPRPGKPA